MIKPKSPTSASSPLLQSNYGSPLSTKPSPDVITDYRTGGTPWFIVINREGKVIHNGYRLELRRGVDLIDGALNGKKAPAPVIAHMTEDGKQGLFKINFPNGAQGLTEYRREGHVLDLLHTEIDQGHRGQGLGGWMMELVLEEIERQGLKARPVCTYARNYLDRYNRWHALKA
jgi:Predicted acetyltransferase